MDIRKLTIIEAVKLLGDGEITAVELIEACYENIEKYNREYNVLLTVRNKDEVLRDAKAMDDAGHKLPLSGIPMILKDLFSTNGIRTTAASKVLDDYIPEYDATVVKRLKEAGVIIIGKANQDAWAHGSSGENSDYGPTRNAYNLDHVAGGSSSGSATAVALGMCLAATGTDTGGSVRVPASYQNLVGLKPTYGRVSRYGIIAMASSLDSISHITKTVRDSAYILEITAGRDPFDATSGDKAVPRYSELLTREDLKGVKIGVAPEYLAVGKKATAGMDPELEKLTEVALKNFEKLGAEIVTVSLPYTQAALEVYYVLCPSEVSSNLARYDGIRFGWPRSKFGAEAKRRMMIGTYALSSGYYDAYYKTAEEVRMLVREDFNKAFKQVDVVFAPVAPSPAPKIGELVDDPLALYLSDIYTVPVNLAGLAALALPAGEVRGLPVGIQIIGPQWSEEKLFSIGKVYEEATKIGEIGEITRLR